MSSDGADLSNTAEAHWFTDRSLEVLIYKINRRPLVAAQLAPFNPPEDLYEHLKLVLKSTHVERTGRKTQRDWRVGNLRFDDNRREVVGRIGWTRSSEALESDWDEESHSFVEKVDTRTNSAVTPFSIVVDGELVGVLRHSSFTTEDTVHQVLQRILRDGEEDRGTPEVQWNVDPMGDPQRFDDWFSSMDQVLSLNLVVKRPNPDNAGEFENIEKRLEVLEAELIQQNIKARDETVGLDKQAVRQDPWIKSFIDAAMRSYGWVKAKGRKDGKQKSFNQQKQDSLREPIDDVGADWETAERNVLEALRNVRDRRTK